MSVQIDETFATALREVLVARVEAPAGRWRPERLWAWRRRGVRYRVSRIGVLLVALAGGGGIAYATGVWTMPGGAVATQLAAPITVTGSGTQTVELGTPPGGATAISVVFDCLTAGTFSFGDGSSESCSSGDIGVAEPPNDLPLAPGQDSAVITATAGARWRLTAAYVSVTTTAWGINASGQTYGVANQHGAPDLVAVQASDGRSGYVYANELNSPAPKTPSQAIAENSSPPVTLTVYESDGKTAIGVFQTRLGGPTEATANGPVIRTTTTR